MKLRIPNYISQHPVMTARYVKTHPHLWFKEYDYVCWIDSNLYFSGDLQKYIDQIESAGADMGAIYHPVRFSFIEEAAELAQTMSVKLERLDDQVKKYKSLNNLAQSRLIETNFWICSPNNPRIVQMMKTWWREINNFTHRDQMSINFAIAETDVNVINLMPNGESARSHEDFFMFSHSVRGRGELIRNLHEQVVVS